MSQSPNSHLDLNQKIFRWCGLSLRDNEGYLYKVYVFVIRLFVIMSPVGAVVVLLQNLDNTIIFVENLTLGGAFMIGAIKYLTIWYIQHPLKESMKILDSEIFLPNVKRGGKKEEELVARCKYVVLSHTFALYSYPILYLIFANIPVLQKRLNQPTSSSWILPFGGFSIFNTTTSPNYEIVLIYQNVNLIIAYFTYIGIVVTLFSVAAHLSYQCKILQNYISRSVLKCRCRMGLNNDFERILKWDYLKNDVEVIVTYHNAITDISKIFCNLFTFTYLMDFVGLSTGIGCCIFYGLLVDSFSFRFVQVLVLAASGVMFSFVSCYWSMEFRNEYLRIADACYEIDFLDADIRFQKSLILIMQRSQKPVMFSVGYFISLTMDTFLVVLKGAYSMFTLLHHTQR